MMAQDPANVEDVYIEPRANGKEFVLTVMFDRKADIEGARVQFIGLTLTEKQALKIRNMINETLARKVVVSLPGLPTSKAGLLS